MITVLLFLAILSLLVLVHECGHFFSARWFGVTAEEFGFGFPPRLFGVRRGKTLYSINWIPLGGFVKIKGEGGDDPTAKDSFAAQRMWKRFVILAAGVAMNFVLAWVLLTVGAVIGTPHVLDEATAGMAVRDRAITIMEVLPGTPAAVAGLKAGDAVTAVGGALVADMAALQAQLRSAADQTFTLSVRREGQALDIPVTTALLKETGAPGIGVALAETGIVSYPWYKAPVRGATLTYTYTRAILGAFADMIGGLLSGKGVGADVAGPVGIAVTTGQVARMGLAYLIQFAAILSINLGIINVLPIPALDGGRVLFLVIETIRRRPNNRQVEGLVHQVGFVVLLALALLVTIQDVRRFGGVILSGLLGLVP